MADLNAKQQAVELIRQADNILVATHKNPDGDALGSLVALKLALEKMGKKVQMACADKATAIFSFLPKLDQVTDNISSTKDFVIYLNTKDAQVEKLGYKKNEKTNQLEIVITPKGGKFSSQDVSSKPSGPDYDLIICLDTPNYDRLGKLAQPADLFYEVPVINIDHHPSNDRYGKVNWVEIVATSTAEILVSLLEALGKDKPLLDEDIATALLTGLIYDTSSFQNINTTPKSLTVAAQLVAAGGRQQEIIKNLYKTKSVETLKLWGYILSNVKEDKMHRFLWSSVDKKEFDSIGADESALSGVVDELLKSATDVDFAMLLSEREGHVHGSLRSIAKTFNVAEIAEALGGGGHEVAAAFRVEGTLVTAEDTILQKIREMQNRNNRSQAMDEELTETIKQAAELSQEKEPVIEEVEDLSELIADQAESSENDGKPKTKW